MERLMSDDIADEGMANDSWLSQDKSILALMFPFMRRPAGETGVMWQRWYIVAVFSAMCISQASAWNFYSPISDSIEEFYGWSEATIAWLENASNIALVVSIPFSAIIVRRFGLRIPTLISAMLIFLGCALRCVTTFLEEDLNTVLILSFVSQALNGLSAAWLNFAAPLLSSEWFPVEERATATAIVTVATYVGFSLGFIIGPLAVPNKELTELHRLYWIEGAVSLTLLLMIWVYFPPFPPIPVSKTQMLHHEQQLEAVVAAQHNLNQGGGRDNAGGNVIGYTDVMLWRYPHRRDFRAAKRLWMIALAYALPIGAFDAWAAVLDLNLKQFNFSVEEAGWLGCWMIMLGSVAAILLGKLSDKFAGKMKLIIVISYFLSLLCFTWFVMASIDVIKASNTSIYVTGVLGGLFLQAPAPLFFELAVEVVFLSSISEGIAASLLVLVVTTVQIIFLCLTSLIPYLNDHTAWMDWTILAVLPLSAIPISIISLRYLRLQLDRGEDPSEGVEGPADEQQRDREIIRKVSISVSCEDEESPAHRRNGGKRASYRMEARGGSHSNTDTDHTEEASRLLAKVPPKHRVKISRFDRLGVL